MGAYVWTLEGVLALGSTAQDAWGLNMGDTGKAAAQAWGEECAGPGVWWERLLVGQCGSKGNRNPHSSCRMCWPMTGDLEGGCAGLEGHSWS